MATAKIVSAASVDRRYALDTNEVLSAVLPTSVDVAQQIRILRLTERAFLGGEQTDVLNLLSGLDAARYAQVLCTEPAGPLVDAAGRLGVRCIGVQMRSRFDVAAVVRLARVMRGGGYDIVHLHGARAGLLGRIVARLAGVRCVVWTMHVFQPDVLQGWRRWQAPVYYAVEWALGRWFCDHIITVSEDLRARAIRLERLPAAKVTMIYSGVDLRPFEEPVDAGAVRRELGLSPAAPVVCTVGRLCEQKGLPDFLAAAARVHALMPEVRFLVVGDGPLSGELAEMAIRLGLVGSVIFTGYRSDVPALLAASDVFATATLWEGMGKMNVEAMATGKPLVSTDVGPIPEVVGDYRGALLVPPHDPEAFADALLRILADLPTYAQWGEEGRQRTHALFGYEAMISRTDALYRQLLAAEGHRRNAV